MDAQPLLKSGVPVRMSAQRRPISWYFDESLTGFFSGYSTTTDAQWAGLYGSFGAPGMNVQVDAFAVQVFGVKAQYGLAANAEAPRAANAAPAAQMETPRVFRKLMDMGVLG